jgi:hypothetical protein
MKKIALAIFFLLLQCGPLLACELCKKNQPRVLQSVTHGTGPTGTLDYVITWSAVILVSVALVLSIKFLVWPKESTGTHIKNIVLNQYSE